MNVNDDTFNTRLNTQRSIAHVGSFLAENGAQQFFFRRNRRFALRRNLADQNVAGLNFGADVNDTGFVKVSQRFFAHVRNVAGDFFLAELGIAGHYFKFLDMQRGQNVIAGNTLGKQNRVFVVQTVPRHKGNQHVFAESQFAHVGTRTVGHDVAGLDHVADLNQRYLVDAGVLVGTTELRQLVNFNADAVRIFVHRTNHDTVGINRVNHTVILADDRCTGIFGNGGFHTGTDQRGFRTQQRYALTLHVRSHQSTVRVVVFQERNKRGRNRHQLFRRNVDEIDVFRRMKFKFAGFAAGNGIFDESAVVADFGVGFRNDVLAFLIGRQINHFVGYPAVNDLAVRAFDKAVFVDAGVSRQRVNQTDVRAFRRFNRADTSVVGRVHVADFKTGAITGQTAGTQSRQTALVGNFRQRVVLIHKL